MAELEPVPAATVILVRESEQFSGAEVLLLLRNSKLVFNGGRWVFPGGRIDDADFAASPDQLEFQAARRAAVRETREESGIAISEKDLIHTAHWTTPPDHPRRFCTWFFICPILEAVEVVVDNSEILDFQWLSPSAAVAAAEAGTLPLPGPTIASLKDLVQHQGLDQIMAAASCADIRVFPENSEYYKPKEMGYLG